MLSPSLLLLLAPALVTSLGFPEHCPAIPRTSANSTNGVCPTDFSIIGAPLEAVHQSTSAPTGLALDNSKNIYLTYPRNGGLTPSNVVLCTSFQSETPWPSAAIQNCTAGQNASTCFINVQNVVLDSQNVMWAVDSGIPYGASTAIPGGAKIMSFSLPKGELIRSYPVPTALLHNGLNLNDVRVNNTLGASGYAFMTDNSKYGSLVAVDLETGAMVRRLFNTTVVKPDTDYVGSFDGQAIYSWNGTTKKYTADGADGLALQSGMVFFAPLASRRFYYVPQSVMSNFSLSEREVVGAVVFPGQLGSETAGFTADDKGRVYLMASEQNAIYYADTLLSEVKQTVDGTKPGGKGLVPGDEYVVKTLVRSGLIQHADTAAILDGWLYFSTNQLELGPSFQYNNNDNRKGPFRSYRVWIGAGPAE